MEFQGLVIIMERFLRTEEYSRGRTRVLPEVDTELITDTGHSGTVSRTSWACCWGCCMISNLRLLQTWWSSTNLLAPRFCLKGGEKRKGEKQFKHWIDRQCVAIGTRNILTDLQLFGNYRSETVYYWKYFVLKCFWFKRRLSISTYEKVAVWRPTQFGLRYWTIYF